MSRIRIVGIRVPDITRPTTELYLDLTNNLDRLCRDQTSIKLNLDSWQTSRTGMLTARISLLEPRTIEGFNTNGRLPTIYSNADTKFIVLNVADLYIDSKSIQFQSQNCSSSIFILINQN